MLLELAGADAALCTEEERRAALKQALDALRDYSTLGQTPSSQPVGKKGRRAAAAASAAVVPVSPNNGGGASTATPREESVRRVRGASGQGQGQAAAPSPELALSEPARNALLETEAELWKELAVQALRLQELPTALAASFQCTSLLSSSSSSAEEPAAPQQPAATAELAISNHTVSHRW